MSLEKDKKEFLYWAHLLYERGLVAGRSGNMSARIGAQKTLLTVTNCYLGMLKSSQIAVVDPNGRIIQGTRSCKLTSEKDLHLGILKKFPEAKVVIHAHPIHALAFFHYFPRLDIFSFESRFNLGKVPVVPQSTPTVTDIKLVLTALENNNIVVLKDHGVVVMGADFASSFALIELLEEQAKINLVLQKKSIPARFLPGQGKPARKIKLFSAEHLTKLKQVLDKDAQLKGLVKKYQFKTALSIRNETVREEACFSFLTGENKDLVISGSEAELLRLFNGEMDHFAAYAQKKIGFEGEFLKISRWYPVIARIFELWQKIPVKI
jgi:ribulose-5-phosphate 4-epimerase/fuculose-1-phosphate aldolase/putative sterol carrier protein